MQENSFKFFTLNYWRSIDKKILFCFLILFFLFSFNSYAQDEPVDIWNIDKSKTDDQEITEEK